MLTIVRLMKTPADVTGPINIGNPNEFTMLGLAEMIMELTNSRSKIVYRPLPQDDPKQRRPDISRASAELGWSPRVGLREGLIKTRYFEQMVRERPVQSTIGAKPLVAVT
jgi:UDP-glucuronate decarboxylase